MTYTTTECPFCGDDRYVGTLRAYQSYVDHLEAHADGSGGDGA